MTASTGSDQLGGDTGHGHSGQVPGLTEQISNIEELVTRLVTKNEEMVKSHNDNVINGNTEPAETLVPVEKMSELQTLVTDKEKMMQDMMAKFSRNR